jgi:hypothetical protein
VADETHEAILAEVDRLGEFGGLPLRPATLHVDTEAPPPDVPYEPGTSGGLDVRADAGKLAAIVVPAGLLALVGMLALAGVVTAVALTVGVLLAIAVAVVGMVGIGGLGAFVVLRASRRTLMAAPKPDTVVAWQSVQPWIGQHTQSPERRLVFVAVDTVARIAGSAAWSSPYLDDHRIRLDLVTELDDIDAQAYQLAELRSRTGGQGHHEEVLRQGWDALVDRVSALSNYADRLAGLAPELARRAEADRAAHADDAAARLLAGSVRDELASDQVRGLTRDLPEVPPAIT